MDEIKAAGGDALAVGGDVSADDFPEKVISATIKYVTSLLSDMRGPPGSPHGHCRTF